MNNVMDAEQVRQKLAELRKSEARNLEFVQDLAFNYKNLTQELELLKTSYKRLEEQSLETTSRNRYAVVLIDGDGYIFRDRLLQLAQQGGNEAAGLLVECVKGYIRKLNLPSQCKILARVYANLPGLRKYLDKSGRNRSANALSAFVEGFNQRSGLVDFVDCGQGKELADNKIREQLEFAMENSQCERLLIACCHDRGYLPVLNAWAPSGMTSSRITLIQMGALTKPFESLGFDVVEFSDVFEPGNVNNNNNNDSRLNATAASARGTNFVAINNSQSFTSEGNIVALNNAAQRVDLPLPALQPNAEVSLMERKKFGKLCNTFQLNGRCLVPHCNFGHDPLTRSQLLALQYQMRGSPCKQGVACRSRVCFYGHLCSKSDCGVKGCKFSANMHGIDVKVARLI